MSQPGCARFAAGTAAALVLLVSPSRSDLSGQSQTFRSGIAVVPLDVRVVDRKGNPVNDLTKADFTVYEDGVRQEITHFERISLVPHTAPQPEILIPGVSLTPGVRAQNRRVFLIQMGSQWLPLARFELVAALRKFLVERLMPQDYAAVSAFGRVTDLTTNHEALAEVIERLEALQKSLKRRFDVLSLYSEARHENLDEDLPMRLALDTVFAPASSGKHLMPRSVRDFENLLAGISTSSHTTGTNGLPPALDILRAVQYLRFVDGEKHLIATRMLALPSVDNDRDVTRIASDARVAIHIISANGLGFAGSPWGSGGEHPSANLLPEMSSKNIAALTGGRASIDRYPDEALAKIDELTRGGYLLAYSPSRPDADGRPRKITIKVTGHDGATLMSRKSYFATDKPVDGDAQQFAAQARVMAVAELPGALPELGVKATASSKGKTADVDVQLDFSQVKVTWSDDRHRAKLEVAVFCSDARQRAVGHQWMTLDLKLTDESFSRAMVQGFHYAASVPVTGPARFVKVVVYDYATGRAGSAVGRVY